MDGLGFVADILTDLVEETSSILSSIIFLSPNNKTRWYYMSLYEVDIIIIIYTKLGDNP